MAEGKPSGERIMLTDEQVKRRRQRSIAIALILAALVAIFYGVTVVKLGPEALNRPTMGSSR